MPTLPDPLPYNPLELLADWLEEARAAKTRPNPDTMLLATVSAGGQPGARAVLCKQLLADPGYLVFYTNYHSAKGADIAANQRVAAVFHWDSAARQARIEGIAVPSPSDESDRYFASRDRDSQLGAWASAQSQKLESRGELIAHAAAIAAHYRDRSVPRPPHWGGYRIWVSAVELWLGGEARLHDRARWERSLQPNDSGDFAAGRWSGHRLQP